MSPDLCCRFRQGDYVRVKREDAAVGFRKPHLRTPGYLFGVVGQIAADTLGYLEDPDADGHHYVQRPRQPLYRCSFASADLWEGYTEHPDDQLIIEIVQSWLEPAAEQDLQQQQQARRKPLFHENDHGHDHEHDHDHGHDHVHEERLQVEQKALDAEGAEADRSRLVNILVKASLKTSVVLPHIPCRAGIA